MQRKFLEELGLEKDMIDKIMDENGKDINREKEKAEAIKEQLDSAKATLKGFEGVDVAQLQGKITQLQADMEAKDADYKAKIADMEFDTVLDAAIRNSDARDAISVRANLDVAALKASKNQTEDIKSALEKVKAEKSFLFGNDEPILNPVAPQSGTGSKGMSGVEAAFLSRNPDIKI